MAVCPFTRTLPSEPVTARPESRQIIADKSLAMYHPDLVNTMGIGIVLLIWAIVASVVAFVGALVLRRAAAHVTRGAQHGRERLLAAATVLPFVCLAWGGAVFIFQAVVNETVLHRDAGLGDTWKCPLPNGYAILLIDTTDEGMVYKPKTQRAEGVVGEHDDAIDGVAVLQVAGRYILGGASSQPRAFGDEEPRVDSYFLLDTQAGTRTEFSTYDALRAHAQELGIQANLQSIESVYSRYRFTAFDIFAVFLLCVPLLIVGFFLVRWTLRVRRTRIVPNRLGV